MLHYRWPGNVRELRAAVEHSLVLCRGDQVTARDLPPAVRTPVVVATEAATRQALSTGKLTMKEAERQLLIHALQEAKGNRTEAAQKLGISRRTLHRRLHEFGLEEFWGGSGPAPEEPAAP
jgi:DNA-binding NtrC family response regulator